MLCASFSKIWGLRNDVKPAMGGSADGFVVWKDFPRGLKILLLDKDALSAVETKSKLEEMDYVGTSQSLF